MELEMVNYLRLAEANLLFAGWLAKTNLILIERRVIDYDPENRRGGQGISDPGH